VNCIAGSLDQKASVSKNIYHGLNHILIGTGNQDRVLTIVARAVRRKTVIHNVYLAVVFIIAATAYLTVAIAIV